MPTRADRWLVRVADGATLAAAAWTLVCAAVQQAGGSPRSEVLWFAGVAAVAAPVAWRWLALPAVAAAGAPDDVHPAPATAPSARRAEAWIGGLSALAFVAWALLDLPLELFALAALPALAALVLARRSGEGAGYGLRSLGRSRRGAWILAACGAAAVFSLAVHRPDGDDGQYLHRAAVLADGFTEAKPRALSLLPGEPTPFPLATHPLEAYYDAIAVLSRATGLEPLEVSAFLVTPAAAAFLVVVLALLLGTVVPRAPGTALAVALALYVLDGTGHRFFTNFGFVRIWQGKALVLSVWLPLVTVYGLWLGSRGRRSDAVRLAAAQVAACGCASVALWMAPAVAVLAVLAGAWGASLRTLAGRLAAAVACSAWPLSLGVVAYAGARETYVQVASTQGYPTTLAGILPFVFEGAGRARLWMGILLAACFAPADPRTRRFARVFLVGTFLTVANPLLAPLVVEHVTSPLVYWRVLWLLPLPAAAAATATVLAGRARAAGVPAAGAVAAAVLLGLYAALAVEHPTWSRRNHAWVGWPSVKVAPPAWRVATGLDRRLPPGSLVLAPESAGWPLGTLRTPLQSYAPRDNVMEEYVLGRLGDVRHYRLGTWVLAYLEGETPLDPRRMALLVEENPVRAVVARRRAHDVPALDRLLRDRGFGPMRRAGPYLVWFRPADGSPPGAGSGRSGKPTARASPSAASASSS